MDLQQFISIILSRKRIILSILITVVATTLVISLLLPKEYVSTASIMIDQGRVDPVTGSALPAHLIAGYTETQVKVIASHNAARKAVEKLKLDEDQQLQEEFAEQESTEDIKDWIADLLLKKLDVKPSRDSNLIEIEFSAPDPQFAADVANAFIDAYVQIKIELRAKSAKSRANWFDIQVSSMRKRLESAQMALSALQKQHSIVATDDHLDLENSRLTQLSQQLVESQVRTGELQAKSDLLASTINQGGDSDSLEEVLNNSLIQSLKSELAQSEAKFAELSKKVDINHPQYKQAYAEVESLRRKIQSEVNMVLRSIASGVAASKQRDKILAHAFAEQKAKVLDLKKQHNEIAVLNREVENAYKEYDAAMERAVQAHMESEIEQTDVSILNLALAPQKPAKPRVLLNIILSILLGAMLGVGLALLVELTDRRVRSVFDISEQLAIPVFAIVSDQTNNSKLPPRFDPDNFRGHFNG